MRNGPHHHSTLRFYKERMLVVLAMIQDRLDETIELDELAQRGGLSRYHFHRVFCGMIGEPLMTHVRRLRLERAAQRLRETSRPVIDVALEAGYDSNEAFTRAFKQAYGVAPANFRRSRGPAEMAARSGVHFREGAILRSFRITPHRPMNVIIETLPPTRVAFVQHVGPYSGCHAAWDKLCTWMGKEGYVGAGCRMFGVCHDDPDITPPERIRYDACITVDEAFKPTADIGVQVLAGGEYARTTHAGPYERLSETYAKLMGDWLPRSGRHMRDVPSLECYLTDPGSTAPADLLTDIYLPLSSP